MKHIIKHKINIIGQTQTKLDDRPGIVIIVHHKTECKPLSLIRQIKKVRTILRPRLPILRRHPDSLFVPSRFFDRTP